MCTFACNGLKARVWGRVGETYGSSLPPTGANGQHPIVHPHRRRHDCRIGANGFGRGEHNAPPGRPHQHHPQGTRSPHPQHLGNVQPHRRCPEGQHSRPGAWSGEKGEGKQSSKGKLSHPLPIPTYAPPIIPRPLEGGRVLWYVGVVKEPGYTSQIWTSQHFV
jgi:hypothetical protein